MRWRMGMGSARAVGVVVALLATVGVGALPASAAGPTVQVAFSPSSGPPGTTFTISGACINDGAPATIAEMDVYSADSNEEQFPNLTVAPDGTFTGSVTLSSAGRYRVVTICRRSQTELGIAEQILRVEDPSNPLPLTVVQVFASPAGSPPDRMRLFSRCLIEDARADSATVSLVRPALADGSPRFEETVPVDLVIDGQGSSEPIWLPKPSDGRYTATLSCVRDGRVVGTATDEVLVGEDVPVAPTDPSTTTSSAGPTTSSAGAAGAAGAGSGAVPATAVAGSPDYTG